MWAIILICGWGMHLALLWLYRIPPSIDYPNWLHQANVLAHYRDAGYEYEQWYTIVLTFIPNGGFVLPTALLARVVPIEIAGKIMLSAYVIFFPLSVRCFVRSTGHEPSSWLICILILFNVSFINGNIAFLLGLCPLFTALGMMNDGKVFQKRSSQIGLIFLTLVLCIAHALCASIFLLYLFFRIADFRATTTQEKRWIIFLWLMILTAGVLYVVTRPASEMIQQFSWWMDARYRLSVLSKSFVAGMTFPPYEFSALRSVSTVSLFIFAGIVVFMSLRNIIRSRSSSSPNSMLFLFVLGLALLSPRYVFGIGEASQRFALILFILALPFFSLPKSRRVIGSAGLVIVGILVLGTRFQEYSLSSNILEARSAFIETVIPESQSILTFDDDLGSRRVPFYYLVPKGINLMFQTNYRMMRGGYDPMTFRTGYIIPRDPFLLRLDTLIKRCNDPGQFLLRGSDVPNEITYVVLDAGSRWDEETVKQMNPFFTPVAKREITPGIMTTILRRVQ